LLIGGPSTLPVISLVVASVEIPVTENPAIPKPRAAICNVLYLIVIVCPQLKELIKKREVAVAEVIAAGRTSPYAVVCSLPASAT
jgi:hypothetical protein